MRILHYLFLSVLLFCSSLSASGQELTVKSFESSNDIISIADQRRDFNDDACALIKVRMISPLERVEGNVVGDIVTRGTEKWVYVTAGTKELRLFPKEYLPLSVVFRNYGITDVEGKHVYILTLQGEIIATVPEVEKGCLTLKVTPKDAVVMIDGKMRQLNQAGEWRDSLFYGTYNYSVNAEGYDTRIDTVTVGEQPVFREVLLDKIVLAKEERRMKFGVNAGINLASASFKEAKASMAIGFYAGFAMRYDFTPAMGLATGLYLTQKGFKSEGGSSSSTANPMFIQIPIEFSYRFSMVRIHAGPYVGFGVSGKLKTTFNEFNKSTSINFFDRYNRLDAGVTAGVALDFNHFSIGANYELGCTGFANRNIQIGLSYLF